ncbi:hypothetical protein GTP46_05975 [Duganella sp. FT135W]|uniref:HEAT repeat domain-containing protein n=1 Tax=Duganella flavida TaxID=2692175 RepID=A0A6L8K6L0_9BURK|nr:HEAT repeat domain-containing protein [Duganella flavida]MYM22187.1 hypothetical protein [Duganella flavida]
MEKIFCSHCFQILQTGCPTCPSCQQRVGYLSDVESRSMLLKMLLDQRTEVRSTAIFALGWRKDRLAADALVACALRHPSNISQGLQIVKVLATIDNGTPLMTALQYLMARHPGSEVKQAAFYALSQH